jgi:predicted DNA-binding protein
MNTKKLIAPKRVLINLDKATIQTIKSIKNKTGKTRSYIIRDSIDHMAKTIDLFSSISGIKKNS